MRETLTRVCLGLLFICIGVGYLGRQVGAWDFTIFFSGWWTMLLIIPALLSMISYGIHISNTFTALLGTYFLLSANDIISFSFTWPVVIAVICICIGLKIIFRKKVRYYDFKF